MTTPNNSSSDLSRSQLSALRENRRGHATLQYGRGLKAPDYTGWQNTKPLSDDADVLAKHIVPGANVGVVLGQASGGLVDCDHDDPLTMAFADIVGETSTSTFGRQGKPASHRLSRLPAGQTVRRITFQDPVKVDGKNAMYAEIRGDGCQTMFPGSVHPSGQKVEWESDGDIPVHDLDDLKRKAGLIAGMAMVTRRLSDSNRHDPLMYLAGALVRAGYTEDVIRPLIHKAGELSGGDDYRDWDNLVDSTVSTWEVGGNVGGFGKLEGVIPDGKAVVDQFRKWLGVALDGGTEHHTVDDESWPVRTALPPAVPSAPALRSDMIPDPLRTWITDLADLARVPPEMVTVPAIVAAGAVIGREVGVRPGQFDHYTVVPNHWGMVVARPGWMKSNTQTEGFRPLSQLVAKAVRDYETAKKASVAKLARLETERDGIKKQMAETVKKQGTSGTSGTSSTRDAEENTKTPSLDALEKQLAAKLDDIEQATPKQRRYRTNDATVEKLQELLRDNPRGLLVVRDELSGWLRTLDRDGREGDREFYLEAWDGTGSYSPDRIGRGSIYIPAITLSVFGGIQPGKIQPLVRAAIAGDSGDDGLLQRFQLFVWPDRLPAWEKPTRHPNEAAKQKAVRVFAQLDGLTPEAVGATVPDDGIPYLRFTPEAQKLFDDWRDKLEHRLRSGELDPSPAFASHLSKYRSLMPGLAITFHLIDWADSRNPFSRASAKSAKRPPAIGEQAVRDAIAWCDYLEAHARKMYAPELHPGLTAAHALADKIASGAVSDGEAVRDIYRYHWTGLSTPDHVTNAIAVLTEYGWCRIAKVTTGGRSSAVLRLHPDFKSSPSQASAKSAKTNGEHDE